GGWQRPEGRPRFHAGACCPNGPGRKRKPASLRRPRSVVPPDSSIPAAQVRARTSGSGRPNSRENREREERKTASPCLGQEIAAPAPGPVETNYESVWLTARASS